MNDVPVIAIVDDDLSVRRSLLWKPFDDDAVLDAIRRAVGADPEPTGPPASLA